MSEHTEHGQPAGHVKDAGHVMDVGYDHAEPSGRPLFLLTAIAAVTVVVMVLAVNAYFNHVYEDAVHERELVPASEMLVGLHQREDKQLYAYQLIPDRSKGPVQKPGTVQLPIDRAMDLLIQESGEGKLPFKQQATPVTTDAATPAPTAAPAPNATPTK